jgi:enoyl-CoA hydratase/carnithine racemase
LRDNALEADIPAAALKEARVLNKMYRTPEQKEAIAAFMEKRAPRFRVAPGTPSD